AIVMERDEQRAILFPCALRDQESCSFILGSGAPRIAQSVVRGNRFPNAFESYRARDVKVAGEKVSSSRCIDDPSVVSPCRIQCLLKGFGTVCLSVRFGPEIQ